MYIFILYSMLSTHFYFILVNILEFKYNKLYNFLVFLLYIELYSFEASEFKKNNVITSYDNWLF